MQIVSKIIDVKINKNQTFNFTRVISKIDNTKPKCFRVGHEWKFNSDISVERVYESVSLETAQTF